MNRRINPLLLRKLALEEDQALATAEKKDDEEVVASADAALEPVADAVADAVVDTTAPAAATEPTDAAPATAEVVDVVHAVVTDNAVSADSADVPPVDTVKIDEVPAAAVEVPVAAAAEPEPVVIELQPGSEVVVNDVKIIAAEDLAVVDSSGAEADAMLAEGMSGVANADDVFEQASDIQDTVTVLEHYADVVELSAGRGGLSVESVALLDIGVNAMYKKIGFDAVSNLPAMEAFAVPGGARIGGTTIALENLKDNIQKIVQRVIEWVKKAFEWVVGFGKRLLDVRYRIEERAKKLAEAGAKLTGGKGGQVGDGALVSKLLKGKAVSTKIATDLTALTGFAMMAADSRTVSSIASVQQGLSRLIDDIGRGEGVSAIVTAIEAVIGRGLKPSSQSAEDLGIDGAPEGTKLFASDVFIGNVVFWAYVPQGAEHFDKLRIGSTTLSVDVQGDAKVAALSGGEIVAVANAALEFTKALDSYRKTEEAVKKFAADYAKHMTKASSSIRADSESVSQQIKTAMSVFQGARHMVKGLHQPAFAAAARAANAALDLAALSVKAHGAAEGASQKQLSGTQGQKALPAA